MRSKSKKNSRQIRRRKANQSYGTLEPRNLLATLIDINQSTGDLTINLTSSNDNAVIAINTEANVTVNGSPDLDTSTPGIQSYPAVRLNNLVIEGNQSSGNQLVAFNDNFGRARTISSVSISDVNQVTLNDVLEISGDLDVRMSGSGGRFGDAIGGQLSVGGKTTINAGANAVGLNNATNDFNELEVVTTGSGQDVVINDINGIVLTGVETSGDFTLTAGGAVEDATNTLIDVAGEASFSASSITLGDSAGDSTNFFTSSFVADGHVDIQEDSNIILGDTDVGSLRLRSVGAIFDGLRTTINVDGHAEFFGNNRVRIGEGGLDTFNAGSIEFRSNGHVHFTENSDSLFIGDNSAGSADLNSWGHIRDTPGTDINIRHETGFQGISVLIGDSPTDVFNTGSLYFFTRDQFTISEDSNTHIIETKNQAGSLNIESAGQVTDALDARVTVDQLASFKANTVNVGDTLDDWFVAGSVSFDTSGLFKISENSDLQITGDNTAARTIINSNGNINNQANTSINVRSSAGFFADNIVLGNQAGDEFNAGTTAFRTASDAAGLVSINEDSATNLGGVSVAKTLQVVSAGNITDGPSAVLNVSGNTDLSSGNNGHIVIGDSGMLPNGVPFDSTFETRTLTLNTDGRGNALIEEDGDIVLAGDIRANSLSLVSTDGQIQDNPETHIDVRFNLNVEGTAVNLGTAVIPNGTSTADSLEFSTLTFNSTGNVNVSADDSFFLIGESETGGFLTLESEGDIRSTRGSELISQEGARFDGMDILIGNLADDCFDIINTNADGSVALSVNGQGTENVQEGCSV